MESRSVARLCLLVALAPACTAGVMSDPAEPPATTPDAAPAPAPVPAMPVADAAAPADRTPAPPDALAAAPDVMRTHASDVVFDEKRVATYQLTIAPQDWQTLLKTPREYVPAMLVVEGEDVGRVGVKFFGNTTLSRCMGANGAIDLTKCSKMSYKVKVDQFDPDKRYRGLKHLSFPNMYGDPTLLRERLSYKLWRDMGVIAPRSVHAKLTINGESKGLFTLTEVVDGRFTDYWFPKGQGDGNLYKQVWPVSKDPNYYIKGNNIIAGGQRTNEGVVPPTKMVAFATDLMAAGETEAGLAKVIGSWMDGAYALRWLAVDEAIKNWDGPRFFQCDSQGKQCVNLNYYLYESQTDNKVWIIPYDPDLAFEKVTVRDEPTIAAWNQPVADCSKRVFVANVRWFQPAWCDKVFRGLSGLGKASYAKAVRALLDGPLVVKNVQATVDAWAAQIADAVKADPYGPKPADWTAAVTAFKNDLAFYRQRMEGILAALGPPQ
jgi:hypothetical protein